MIQCSGRQRRREGPKVMVRGMKAGGRHDAFSKRFPNVVVVTSDEHRCVMMRPPNGLALEDSIQLDLPFKTRQPQM